MSILDTEITPVALAPTNQQRANRIRRTAGQLRDALQQSVITMKKIAQNGDGVAALVAHLNSENDGDGAELQSIYNGAKALLARLDEAASDNVGDLS